MFRLKNIIKLFFSLSLAVVLLFGLLACGNGDGKLDPNKKYSSITESCKLTSNYEGKDFVKDGIGIARLNRVADGDTASFVLESGQGVTIRFFGIDTPESTGQVDKWGLSASLFTKAQVNTSTQFVLESSTGGPAEKDSYGVRYLGYVWYRNSSNEDWKNLNLLVVENGYSKCTVPNSPVYEYYPFFKKAENFAKAGELHIHGDDDDPNYSNAAYDVTIKEIIDHQNFYWNEEVGAGLKVRLTVIITNLEIGSGGTHTFTGAQIIDGKLYTYSIYTGYSSGTASSYLKIGNTYCITGFVQNHYGDYQISGLEYVLGETGGDYTYRTEAATYLTFNSGIEYSSKYHKNLKTDAYVEAASLSGTTLTLTISAYTQTKNGPEDTKETYTVTVEVSENFDVNTVLKKNMSGFIYKNGENYIALNLSDLSFK